MRQYAVYLISNTTGVMIKTIVPGIYFILYVSSIDRPLCKQKSYGKNKLRLLPIYMSYSNDKTNLN